jgi:hypothetical protein
MTLPLRGLRRDRRYKLSFQDRALLDTVAIALDGKVILTPPCIFH